MQSGGRGSDQLEFVRVAAATTPVTAAAAAAEEGEATAAEPPSGDAQHVAMRGEAAPSEGASTDTPAAKTARIATAAGTDGDRYGSDSWLPPRPMLIGRRGLPLQRPENTL